MFDDNNKYFKYQDLRWSGILKSIAKSPDILQPLFEGFTNSIESIRLRSARGDSIEPYIRINLSYNATLSGEMDVLSSISIIDNGVGFDSKNFKRLTIFKDDTKGFNNRGSGRIQLIHAFQYVTYDSAYMENGSMYHRAFALSKADSFLSRNTILYEEEQPVLLSAPDTEQRTILKMCIPVEKDNKAWENVSVQDIKKALIDHYILLLCNIKSELPQIEIKCYLADQELDKADITKEDIPDPTTTDTYISVPKYKISNDMKRLEEIEEDPIIIQILPYKICADRLSSSEIKITSKGELSNSTKIKVTCIDPQAAIDNCRYLFLLRSQYFDDIEGDERGNIEILDKTELKKRAKNVGYIEEQIVLNDIQDQVNAKASEIYTEILLKKEEFQGNLERLRKEYLLSEEALEEVSLSDSIDDIFKKAYSYDAKIMAQQSAAYEQGVQGLNALNPASEDYQTQLSNLVDQVVESVPIQNRTTLSKYVVRRKMVVELMDKIINQITNAQNEAARNEDEKLLHNLIFKQHSNNPLTSDLWLINEEYMYFRGCSEQKLSQVKLEGNKIFKDEFDEEEERYLNSLGSKRLSMRADVLLFPSEGKCVIIEFKNPDVNVSDYLNQISKYAYYLANYTKDEYKLHTFYGYLVGESIENQDVWAADGEFRTAPKLDYLYRQPKTIRNKTGEIEIGSLYMEVIKYSVIKQRAEVRNQAFVDTLFHPIEGEQLEEDATSEET